MLEFYLMSVLLNVAIGLGFFLRDKDDLDGVEFRLTMLLFVILGFYVYLLLILALLISPIIYKITGRGV